MPHMRERRTPDDQPVDDPNELPQTDDQETDLPRPSSDAVEEPEPDVTTDEPTSATGDLDRRELSSPDAGAEPSLVMREAKADTDVDELPHLHGAGLPEVPPDGRVGDRVAVGAERETGPGPSPIDPGSTDLTGGRS